jgi:hypothetical protein
MARRGSSRFAIGAMSTHYGAPLVTGFIVGDTVGGPWHHANGQQNPTRSPKRRLSTNPERARGGGKGAQGEPSKVGTV